MCKVDWSVCVAAGVSLLAGCGPRVEFMQYRGVQNWPTGSAFVRAVKGMEVYEGLPDRPYEVVGLIDIYDNKPFFFNASATKDVLDYARNNNANALVWLSKRVVTSGSLRMAEADRDPAEIDTGRSTQPLVIRTQGSASGTEFTTQSGNIRSGNSSMQYREDVWVEPQRSTVLAVRWK